jgi:tetratricopeptide (TPR) repeat protein
MMPILKRTVVSSTILFLIVVSLPILKLRFTLPLIPPVYAGQVNVNDLLDEGDRRSENGDYAGAIESYQKVLDASSRGYYYRALSHGKMGLTYGRWGKYDKALEHFEKSLNLFNDSRTKREVRGIVENETYATIVRNLISRKAEVYELTGDYDNAIETLKDLTKVGKNPDAEIDRLKKMVADKKEAEQKKQEALEKATLAEQQGQMREAFQHYQILLNTGNTFNFSTMEKIIEIYHKLDPKPAIPEEARKYAQFGFTAAREAKDKKGYNKAIGEYFTAIRLAPWWADLYVNISLVLEEFGDFDTAHKFLRFYLLAEPKAQDTEKVKMKLYELEYKAREQSKK